MHWLNLLLFSACNRGKKVADMTTTSTHSLLQTNIIFTLNVVSKELHLWAYSGLFVCDRWCHIQSIHKYITTVWDKMDSICTLDEST